MLDLQRVGDAGWGVGVSVSGVCVMKPASVAPILAADRRHQSLSLRQLAARAGLPLSTVAAVLGGRGDPGVATVGRVLVGLGRDWWWLAGRMGETQTTTEGEPCPQSTESH